MPLGALAREPAMGGITDMRSEKSPDAYLPLEGKRTYHPPRHGEHTSKEGIISTKTPKGWRHCRPGLAERLL